MPSRVSILFTLICLFLPFPASSDETPAIAASSAVAAGDEGSASSGGADVVETEEIVWTWPAAGEGDRPVVGLTLSGGSAKGLAHIGVLKVLEEEGIRIDLVTGNSMGSLMGALYALGYTPAMLEDIALNTDWVDLLSNKFDRQQVSIENKERMERYMFELILDGYSIRPLSGLLSGRKVHRFLARLTWPANFVTDFSELPRPFRCLATDICTGEGIILEDGALADAMRASMAIPGVFAPIEIDGRMLVDGMLVRNFPTEDALDMGATILIGSDVGSEPLDLDRIHSLLDIVNQSVVLADVENRQSQLDLCDLLILPRTGDLGSFSFSNAAEIIRRGEEAAREKIEEIRHLADYLSAWEVEPFSAEIDLERAMHICDLRIDCKDEIDLEAVTGFIGIEPPCDVTVDQLESIVDYLYGLGSSSLVRYGFEDNDGCNTLVFKIDEDNNDYVYSGLRFDTTWRTSILINLSLKDFLNSHSDLEVDILLGRRMRLGTQYDFQVGTKNRVGLRGDFEFLSDWLDIYDSENLVGRMDSRSVRTGLFLDYAFSRYLFWDFGILSEWSMNSPQVAPVALDEEWTRLNLLAMNIWFDNLDRSWFPTRGVQLRLRGEYGDFDDINTDQFNRFAGRLLTRLPLGRHFSIGTRLLFGLTAGGEVPGHYRFYIGGENAPFVFQDRREINFYGYQHQELSGEHAFVAGLDLQFKFSTLYYLLLHGNAGKAVETWSNLFLEEERVYGVGITAGIATPFGPIEFTASHSERHDLQMYFGAGYRF